MQRGNRQQQIGDLEGALASYRSARSNGCTNPGLDQSIADLTEATRPPPPARRDPIPSNPPGGDALPASSIADICTNSCGSWKFYRQILGGGGTSYPGTPEISCHRNNYWQVFENEIREYQCDSGYTNCRHTESYPIFEQGHHDSGTYSVTYGEDGDRWMTFASEPGKVCRSPGPTGSSGLGGGGATGLTRPAVRWPREAVVQGAAAVVAAGPTRRASAAMYPSRESRSTARSEILTSSGVRLFDHGAAEVNGSYAYVAYTCKYTVQGYEGSRGAPNDLSLEVRFYVPGLEPGHRSGQEVLAKACGAPSERSDGFGAVRIGGRAALAKYDDALERAGSVRASAATDRFSCPADRTLRAGLPLNNSRRSGVRHVLVCALIAAAAVSPPTEATWQEGIEARASEIDPATRYPDGAFYRASHVRLEIDGDLFPQPGDIARFQQEVPGVGAVEVAGDWMVVDVSPGSAVVTPRGGWNLYGAE